MELITGVGFTVSSSESVVTQPEPKDKVKRYFTTIGCIVVLFNVSLMSDDALLPAELLIPETVALDHEKFVPVLEPVLLVAV